MAHQLGGNASGLRQRVVGSALFTRGKPGAVTRGEVRLRLVGTHPARRVWVSLETLHDVIYFADGVRPAGIALGLKGFWMTYFAFRAAPLGPVAAPVAVAAFAGFHPAMVAKALPEAWSRTTPQACIDARTAVSTATLREVGVDPGACDRAAALLGPVAAAADPTGRPLFAANAALPPPGDAIGRLWQLATTLREHRGDGHIAALVAEGITGLQAHLLQVAGGRFPDALIRQARGWPAQEWAAAAETLRARGLLTADSVPRLTGTGRALLDGIESRTDELAWTGGLCQLGEQRADQIVALLRPSVRALVASGMLPDVNPTGLPHPA
jgi:Helix-turn-helix family